MRNIKEKLLNKDSASKKIIVEVALIAVIVMCIFVYKNEITKTEEKSMEKVGKTLEKMMDPNYKPNQDDPVEDGDDGVEDEIPEPVIPVAGLYDENDNLIVSWEDSGIDMETDYTYNGYSNIETSGYYVTQIKYPNTRKVVIPNSVNRISNSGFNNCVGLTSIVIPNSVTSIGELAFRTCTGLTSIEIPDSVTSIGQIAFWGCSGLTSVILSDNLTYIGPNAFYRCTGLTSIVIPDSVINFSSHIFDSCSNLISVVIGKNVNAIPISLFYNCSNLMNITYNGTVNQWNALSKGSIWKQNVPATYVQCSDGQVSIV